MSSFKKSVAAIFSLSSAVLFAGTMGDVCAIGNVSVPCDDPAFGFSIQGLYLQPTVGANFGYQQNLTYLGLENLTTGFNDYEFNQTKPRTSWGFRVVGSYHYEDGMDITVNWLHFSNSINHQVLGSLYLSPTTIVPIYATSKVEPQWNSINFESGQHVDFGECQDIRFHAGFGIVQLKQQVSAEVFQLNPISLVPFDTEFAVSNDKVEFKGFGPRIGADMSYELGYGFSVYGNGAAGLFIGRSKFNDTFVSLNNTSFLINGIALQAKKTALVPEVEAKLGVRYTYEIAQGDVTIDLGYMSTNYFNALHAASLDRFASPMVFETDVAFSGAVVGFTYLGVA